MSKALSLSAILALVAGLAMAQTTFTESSGTEQLDRVDNVGEVNCHGAPPTGNPFVPCPPGTGGTFRAQRVVTLVQTNDQRTDGVNYIVGNGNVHADGTMQIWGTFRLEVNGGGVWEGTWHGSVNSANRRLVSGVGHGSGGIVNGLQFLMDEAFEPGQPVASVRFRILAPANK